MKMLKVAQGVNQIVKVFVDEATLYHTLFSHEPDISNVTTLISLDAATGSHVVDFVVADHYTGHGYVLITFDDHHSPPRIIDSKSGQQVPFPTSSGEGARSFKLFWNEAEGLLQICQVTRITRITLTWWRLTGSGSNNLEKVSSETVPHTMVHIGFTEQANTLWSVFSDGDKFVWLSDRELKIPGNHQPWWVEKRAPIGLRYAIWSEDGDAVLLDKGNQLYELWTRISGGPPERLRSLKVNGGTRFTNVIWYKDTYELVGVDTTRSKVMMTRPGVDAPQQILDVAPLVVKDLLFLDCQMIGEPQLFALLSNSSLVVHALHNGAEVTVNRDEPLLIGNLSCEVPQGLTSAMNALRKRVACGHAEIARKQQALMDARSLAQSLAMSLSGNNSFHWPQNVDMIDLQTALTIPASSMLRDRSKESVAEMGEIIGTWFHGPTSYAAVHLKLPKRASSITGHLSSTAANISQGNFAMLNQSECLIWGQMNFVDRAAKSIVVDAIMCVDNPAHSFLAASFDIPTSALLVPNWLKLSGNENQPPRLLFQGRSMRILSIPKLSPCASISTVDVFAADELRLNASLENLRDASSVIARDWSDSASTATSLLTQLRQEIECGVDEKHTSDLLAAELLCDLSNDI